MKISNIVARQILDSRGNPTVEADVWLDSGVFGRAAVPSGASTGQHEAHEVRDGGSAWGGLGVQTALQSIHEKIVPAVRGMRADDQFLLDKTMIELDGTANKESLGANAILAVSLATAHAAAKERGVLLYQHINDIAGNPPKAIPMPMMNVLNGGKHANNSSDFQEFMIIPIAVSSYKTAVQMCVEVFQKLRRGIAALGGSSAVGDEGGLTLEVKSNEQMLVLLNKACEAAGYTPGKDICYALDVAATELYHDGKYILACDDRTLTGEDMIHFLDDWVQRYPIVSIEDGLAEDDWSHWTQLTQRLSDIQLVGDDLLVTNITRLQHALDSNAANAILIKPNQIGTLTETVSAIKLAQNNGWRTIVSHRSGETEDTTIAHLAVGTGAGQIKTGSVTRSERTAKHNELMRIESIDAGLVFSNPFA